MESLGIRNNNAGNIEKNNKTRWQGQSDIQPHPRFASFKAPKWGIRAIARTLITYQDKRTANDGSPIDTVSEIIERWAPEHENPTNAYARFVAAEIKESATGKIDVYDYDTMFGIVSGIIHFENGYNPYDKKTIDQGLRLAGIEVPVEQALSKSRTVKAGTVGTASIGLGVATEVLTQSTSQLTPLIEYSDIIKMVFVGLTLASILVTVWARIDDANKEVRS